MGFGSGGSAEKKSEVSSSAFLAFSLVAVPFFFSSFEFYYSFSSSSSSMMPAFSRTLRSLGASFFLVCSDSFVSTAFGASC